MLWLSNQKKKHEKNKLYIKNGNYIKWYFMRHQG